MRGNRPPGHALLQFSLLMTLLAGLLLPWLLAPNAPMTLNAYDLAEWASLHPAQRATNPPLLAPLLLRAQLLILCVLVGLVARGKLEKRAAALVIFTLAVAQLPPIEFVNDIGNLNYRQQFGLALSSLLLGMAALCWMDARWRRLFVAGLSLLGALTTLAGASLALDVFASLASGGSAGLGIWIVQASYCCLFVTGLRTLFFHILPPP